MKGHPNKPAMKLELSCSLGVSRPLAVPFVGPLDAYTSGLTVCWSVTRRLLASYTGYAFLARADRTGQPTMNIPFKADGTWDTAVLLAFAGSDSVYVVTEYAQYGSIDFTQSTASLQPRIVNAGVLEPYGARFDGTQTLKATLDASAISGGGGTTAQIVTGVRQAAADTGHGLWSYNSQQSGCFVKYPGLGIISDVPGSGGRIIAAPSGWDDVTHVLSQERNGASSVVRVAGTVIGTNASASGSISGTAAEYAVGLNGSSFSGWISGQVIWSDTTNAAGRAAALA